MIGHSYLSNAEIGSIEELYDKYRTDPNSVEYGWQKFFEGFDLASGKLGIEGKAEMPENFEKENNVLHLINNGYRTRGHFFTRTNPVRERRQYRPTLDLENFGLEKSDLEKEFHAGIELGLGKAKLKDIIGLLQETYCESIGVEYMYIPDPAQRVWLQKKMESRRNKPNFNAEEKKNILNKLNQAVVFENFLHTKYVGQKRFSLEGLETLIPALDTLINYGASHGTDEVVIGMAHRGRLNVLANIMQKNYEEIFSEFEGQEYEDAIFEGDVKYHLGFSSNIEAGEEKTVRLTLCPNPSHLESVGPVAIGLARAKLDGKYNKNVDRVLPVIIHGDASIAGQGVVYESIQMAALEGYSVGGSIHVVTNNQVGFTTNYLDGRSSIYCTDVAKTTKCPVFHVNGDDVEALVYTIQLALEYRQEFNSDVFIDILGYRKYGHNEGDEPRFTQPVLYKAINKHPNPREIYVNKLLEGGKIDSDIARQMEKNFKQMLQDKLNMVRNEGNVLTNNLPRNTWSHIRKAEEKDFEKSPDTAIEKELFVELAKKITDLPEGFQPFRKMARIFDDRKAMIDKDAFDWAMGELMAYASLLNEGHPVRMSGQDCERGTFSHRHAVVKKEDSEEEYIPLSHVSPEQATFEIYNSLLSEYAVLGFEYGYAMSNPDGLTIWEAQFGDFCNVAQVIIDQYISSGETKWKRFNGLTLLLPHGYEGQGPEHSSARLERFLQLSANLNMQVVNITTPANFFHALRRQVSREIRVPLIVMSPKSLLRHPLCVSTIKDFTTGGFQELIDDQKADAKKVKRVLFCSGKLYYELLEKQQNDQREDVAIVRLEQLYPLPEKQLAEVIKKYGKAELYWVQEEPKNMGVWMHLLRYEWPKPLKEISRRSSSTPATGYAQVHRKEQQALIDLAFS
jgi:2-oxoglutarate dehydrogenase E1 component